MKKDVGIITIHYVDNLGGALLAFALQDSVDRMGYNCHVIDYDPTPIPSRVRYLAILIIPRVLRIPIYLRDFQYYFGLLVKSHGSVLPPMHIHRSVGIRKTRFDEFRRKYIKLSEQHYNSSESLLKSPPEDHAYICGSDQIWNPFICKEPAQAKNDPAYFLSFTTESKRISYAPSIALPSIPENFREEMTEMLQGIPYLSSREKHGVEIIKELTGRDAEVVVDPTLLLNSGQWNQIAAEPAIKGPYILCYFLGDGLEYRNFAEQLHKKTGLRLIVISQRLHDLESLDTINCSNAGPAEFLGLVKNASCVCTDSYHGTISLSTSSGHSMCLNAPGLLDHNQLHHVFTAFSISWGLLLDW